MVTAVGVVSVPLGTIERRFPVPRRCPAPAPRPLGLAVVKSQRWLPIQHAAKRATRTCCVLRTTWWLKC
jgi:hypothetical protein